MKKKVKVRVKKTKKDKNEIINEHIKEILSELKKLNENTNNGKLEKEWKEIYPNPDSTGNWQFPDVKVFIRS